MSILHQGILFRLVGRYKESLRQFNKLEMLSADPDRTVFQERGMVYQMIDNHKRAKKDFKKAIELKKDYAIAHFCLGKSRLELFKQNKSQLGGVIG
jgi:tetratricopeptide (TPR) repeat protein